MSRGKTRRAEREKERKKRTFAHGILALYVQRSVGKRDISILSVFSAHH